MSKKFIEIVASGDAAWVNHLLQKYPKYPNATTLGLSYTDLLPNHNNSMFNYISNKFSVLQIAIHREDEKMVNLLLIRGANPNYKNAQGESAIDLLERSLNPEMKRIFRVLKEKA